MVSTMVTREPPKPPEVPDEMYELLSNYVAFIRGEVPEFNRDLAERVMKTMNNTWNNEDVSPAAQNKNRQALFWDIDSALEIAKEHYAKCQEVRTDFEVKVERISELDRVVRCTTSWVGAEDGGRHLRYASPREHLPAPLAHFLRVTLEGATV